MKKRLAITILSLVGVAVVVVGLAVFKPWLLWVDVRVNDALPIVAPSATSAPEVTAPPTAPVALSTGTFISHEHETSGTATIVENPDGTRVLALENLVTSNGPDVHVWLSAADVVEGTDGWYTAGTAEYLDLGAIKGNVGNQVYDIPEGFDLTGVRSVDLWCVQFGVSFGAAQLQ